MLVNLIRTALARLHPPAGYVILILMLEKLCSGVRYCTVLCHAPKQQGKGIPMKIGFDNNKYLAMQSAHIRERISQFDNKLYLEFGGKLFDDYHASRVLPGFQPDSKLQMLLQLKDQAEIVVVISAEDIISNKMQRAITASPMTRTFCA